MRPWLAIAILTAACSRSPAAEPTAAKVESCRCRPDDTCWPDRAAWQSLGSRLTGSLVKPRPLAELAGVTNPFELQDDPAGTQSTGWLDGWTAAPSTYAVAAETAADVAEAVRFAARYRLRLAIKGTGHDYLGRSNAPDSLLVWTHEMRDVSIDDSFVPAGCKSAGVPAVNVGAGARWLDVYARVTPEHGRYVQGGGCVSVGAAGGFIQGGGFGSWSKKYGTAAAGMLEAEVVTADGQIRIANACQNQDLFWALRGGGGGTFGVVTRVTLMTHELPDQLGAVQGSIHAASPEAMVELLAKLIEFARDSLMNEHWGEKIIIDDDSLELAMVFQGLSQEQAEAVWKPFRAWLDSRPRDFRMKAIFFALPARMMWDHDALDGLPGLIQDDPRPDAPPKQFWWANNGDEVASYWNTYQSRWLPLRLFAPDRAQKLAQTLFDASRHWGLEFHFGKGLGGASRDAVERSKQTSTHPAVYDAAALVIAAANVQGIHPGVAGHEPDRTAGERERARVSAAMKLLRDATPGAGSYVNETDYFEPDWQRSFWGDNYPRLLAIKNKYDPDGLFTCHHCVGSEAWSDDGMCRR